MPPGIRGERKNRKAYKDMKHRGIKNKIRYYRRIKGITQKELAEKVGCSYVTINNIELNKVEPTAYTAGLISKALGVKFEELYTIEEKK